MIDINKKYRTRNGREVRIYATDGRAFTEVHGAILENNGWVANHWGIDGKHDHISFNSLVEMKPRIQRTVWLNVYSEACGGPYWTKGRADKFAEPKRLACVKVEIDCEDGEGL